MNAQPLVSVIVPSFNYGHFLAQTLASVRAQSWSRWECIIVDDGSTDDTWEVALAHTARDGRIKYLRRNNGGLAAARNSGLGAAVGDYVQFLDADDALEARKLEAHVGYLERHRETGLVYGSVRYFDSDTGARRRALFSDQEWMPQISGDGERLMSALLRANIMVVSSPLLRRSVIDAVGGFDESLTSLEDWDYWLRCAAAGTRFDYFDDLATLALVRVHQRSMSQNRITMYQQQRRVREAMHAALPSDALRDLNRYCLSQELAQLGRHFVECGDSLIGAGYLVKAAYTHPRSGRADRMKEALKAVLRIYCRSTEDLLRISGPRVARDRAADWSPPRAPLADSDRRSVRPARDRRLRPTRSRR